MQGIKETQENTVLIPGLERSPGAGNGNQLQNSCLGNPMDRGVWWVTIHGVTESDTTELLSTHAYMYLFGCAGCSCGMWDLQCLLWHVRLFFFKLQHVGSSSRAPCIGSEESYPLDHQGSPGCLHF